MSGSFTYRLGDAVYVNLTNRCSNDCVFCLRRFCDGVGGYDLRLDKEPTGADVIAELEEERPASVVFCGFGEPTMNLDALLEAARFVKSYGGRVRVDTNGHAGLLHEGRRAAEELIDCVDEASISLNAPDPESYARITRCRYGEKGFDAMLDFARMCVARGVPVTMTAVDVIADEELRKCAQLADSIGARFRTRPFVE